MFFRYRMVTGGQALIESCSLKMVSPWQILLWPFIYSFNKHLLSLVLQPVICQSREHFHVSWSPVAWMASPSAFGKSISMGNRTMVPAPLTFAKDQMTHPNLHHSTHQYHPGVAPLVPQLPENLLPPTLAKFYLLVSSQVILSCPFIPTGGSKPSPHPSTLLTPFPLPSSNPSPHYSQQDVCKGQIQAVSPYCRPTTVPLCSQPRHKTIWHHRLCAVSASVHQLLPPQPLRPPQSLLPQGFCTCCFHCLEHN